MTKGERPRVNVSIMLIPKYLCKLLQLLYRMLMPYMYNIYR